MVYLNDTPSLSFYLYLPFTNSLSLTSRPMSPFVSNIIAFSISLFLQSLSLSFPHFSLSLSLSLSHSSPPHIFLSHTSTIISPLLPITFHHSLPPFIYLSHSHSLPLSPYSPPLSPYLLTLAHLFLDDESSHYVRELGGDNVAALSMVGR